MDNEDFEEGYLACLFDMRVALSGMGIELDLSSDEPVLRWFEISDVELLH